ncbi:MAG: hypothetical protein U1E36_07035 [Rickettsiales bacterium]
MIGVCFLPRGVKLQKLAGQRQRALAASEKIDMSACYALQSGLTPGDPLWAKAEAVSR